MGIDGNVGADVWETSVGEVKIGNGVWLGLGLAIVAVTDGGRIVDGAAVQAASKLDRKSSATVLLIIFFTLQSCCFSAIDRYCQGSTSGVIVVDNCLGDTHRDELIKLYHVIPNFLFLSFFFQGII